MPVKIFFSHSSLDGEIVAKIVALLRAALVIGQRDIRCTSLPKYGLPGGVRVSDHIRDEVKDAGVLIGLISPGGFSSAWVLFELGARWGAGKSLIPLLAPGVPPSNLEGPIREIHALLCDRREDIEKLIERVAEELQCDTNPASEFAEELDDVLEFGKRVIDDLDPAPVREFLAARRGEVFYPSAIAKGAKVERSKVLAMLEKLILKGDVEEVVKEYGATFRIKDSSAGGS